MKKQKKCYIYTRVSTAIQVDGYSLDVQKDKLRKYSEYQLVVWQESNCLEFEAITKIRCYRRIQSPFLMLKILFVLNFILLNSLANKVKNLSIN